MINELQNLRKGEKLVYYTGPTPSPKDGTDKLCVERFQTAYQLYKRGKVTLVQKLISRTSEAIGAIGVFEYIAVGK